MGSLQSGIKWNLGSELLVKHILYGAHLTALCYKSSCGHLIQMQFLHLHNLHFQIFKFQIYFSLKPKVAPNMINKIWKNIYENIFEIANHRVKPIQTWGTCMLVEHICGTFELVVFNVILRSFGAIVSKWPVTLKRLSVE